MKNESHRTSRIFALVAQTTSRRPSDVLSTSIKTNRSDVAGKASYKVFARSKRLNAFNSSTMATIMKNDNTKTLPPHFVGIDWADREHEVCSIHHDGKVTRCTLPHDAHTVDALAIRTGDF